MTPEEETTRRGEPVIIYGRKGTVVVMLNERAKRGDIITDGAREWQIRGVETFAICNPPLPWGFMLPPGEEGPAEGAEVSIVKGPEHEAMRWPGER